MSTHKEDINQGRRFEFGANWQRFLSTVSERRIEVAESSLKQMLAVDRLEGKRFLDVGSGSGLFSLAARRLGADVVSFDFDPASVECTIMLKQRYCPDDPRWTVREGSVLDSEFLRGLDRFDVVYSWGVLHHTGAMWEAMRNVAGLVVPGGVLFIAIYNDQGSWSRRWLVIKRTYNRLPRWLRLPYGATVMGARELWQIARATITGKLPAYLRETREYSERSLRGMSLWHDLIDWVGGYPFEVAKPEQIFNFYRDRDFTLTAMTTAGGGIACNEFVFRKAGSTPLEPSSAVSGP